MSREMVIDFSKERTKFHKFNEDNVLSGKL